MVQEIANKTACENMSVSILLQKLFHPIVRTCCATPLRAQGFYSDGNLMTNGYDNKLACDMFKSNKSATQTFSDKNKIEGTPILKLALVKIL